MIRISTAKKFFLTSISIFIFTTALFFVFFEIAKVDVSTSSMIPTLNPGDYFLSYKFSTPKRFRIFLIDDPEHEKKILVKRIIGLPSEKLDIYHGIVRINGSGLYEPYLKTIEKRGGTSSFLNRSIQISQDNYFFLGDNRNVSEDSRDFGTVHKAHFRGRVILIFWPVKNEKIFWEGR